MVTMGVFPFQGKAHMVEPGIESGTSWLAVRSSDHQATRLVNAPKIVLKMKFTARFTHGVTTFISFLHDKLAICLRLIFF